MVISIINQKGGVGKSTTAHALSTGLSHRGYNVLLIDADPQSNITYILGDKKPINDLYSVLNGGDIKDAINYVKGYKDKLSLIASNQALASIDLVLKDVGREYTLKNVIEPIRNDYDFIIIDTPPSLNILTINALTCSDKVIIPVQADMLSIQGVGQLYDTIQTIRKYTNPKLEILGVLRTRYSKRTILSRDISDMLDDVAFTMNTRLYDTCIRESIVIKEVQALQEDMYLYSPNNNAVKDYNSFVEELLNQLKELKANNEGE